MDLDRRETTMRDDLSFLAMIEGDVAAKLSPPVMQAMVQRREAREAREKEAMYRAMPELADAAKLDQFRSATVETLSRYGFRPAEMVITDHRLLLVIRDLQRAENRLARLTEAGKGREAQGKPFSKPNAPGGRGNGMEPKQQAAAIAARGGRDNQARAVATLLKGF
jgi:hypothetical protein